MKKLIIATIVAAAAMTATAARADYEAAPEITHPYSVMDNPSTCEPCFAMNS